MRALSTDRGRGRARLAGGGRWRARCRRRPRSACGAPRPRRCRSRAARRGRRPEAWTETYSLDRLEQALAHEPARLRPGRDGEEAAADVLDVPGERVGEAEGPLDRDELAVRVALERDEEEARVELAGDRVGAVRERVAAAQDPLAAVRRRRGQPDVRVRRDLRRGEVDLVELLRPGERRAALLEPPDHALLLVERRAVPGLDEHPDPPCDEVRPAAHPRLRLVVADPHELPHLLRVVAVEVVRPVLEALEVAQGLLRADRG